jgi:hypothetical protein
MKTEVVNFKREYLQRLHEKKVTASVGLTSAQLGWYESHPWTIALLIDNEPMLCGGIFPHWPGRGEAWAVVSEHAKEHVPAVHRAALRLIGLAQASLVRIDAVVAFGHSEARRWVGHLGFTLEAPRLARYFPDGTDGVLYARVRED